MKRQSCILAFAIAVIVATPAIAKDDYFDSDGVNIHYIVEGKGDPVLLIHGFGVSIPVQWNKSKLIPTLAERYQVIAIDNRGHGRSGKPRDPAKYGAQMMEDQIRLLDHLKIDKVHLVGYSMGAFISLKLASERPERVRSVTLGGAGFFNEDPQTTIRDQLADNLEQGKGIGVLIKELWPAGKPMPSDEEMQRTSLIAMSLNDPKALAAVVRNMDKLYAEESKIKAMKMPVLAIVGDQDPLLHRSVEPLMKIRPETKLVLIKDGTHMDAFAKPEFREEVVRFIDAAEKAGDSQ